MKVFIAFLLVTISSLDLPAQSVTNATVFSFSGTNGSGPLSVVLNGNTIYGAAMYGSDPPSWSGNGTVFSVNTNGTEFTNLVEFMGTNGSYANGLVYQSNMLYGTTSGGGAYGYGYGTLFSLSANGSNFMVLHSFDYTNGGVPEQYVILVSNVLYGTTFYPTNGVVYAYDLGSSNYSIIHRFAPTTQNAAGEYTNVEGANPLGGVILSGNTLFGTTLYGGYYGQGAIFRVNINGNDFTNLYNFTAKDPDSGTNIDGAAAESALILVGNTLYGVAYTGGYYGYGTIFCVNTGGQGFSNLYNFTGGDDGAYPHCGFVLSSDTLYGTAAYGGANGSGTVFAINTDGSQFTNIYQFTDDSAFNSDGANPQGPLIYTNDIFYGTTGGGGEPDGNGVGTIFSLVPTGSGAPSAPTLSIELSGTNEVVFWPVSAGYVLQSATSLSESNWATISSGTITNGAFVYYTNVANANAAFFRLYQ
jgi:uncharacterized repeat protein (TIGR03803 family)